VIVYLDSSALVKLFVSEPQDHLVHDWVQQADVVATSQVAYAEACSALARSQREGRLSPARGKAALTELSAKWPDFAVIIVDELAAGDLAVKRALRGFDAIHLAAALRLCGETDPMETIFVTFDDRQARAAAAEGFSVVPEPGSKARPPSPVAKRRKEKRA